MYQKTTNSSELTCDFCNKKILAGSEYFDDSTYNSLYGKVEIQKSICFKCGTKHNDKIEKAYQKYEFLQRGSRIVWTLILIALCLYIVINTL